MNNLSELIKRFESDDEFVHWFKAEGDVLARTLLCEHSIRVIGRPLKNAEVIELALHFREKFFPPVSSTTLKKEQPMSSEFFVTKHFVNGRELSTLQKAEVYGAIAMKEAELANLEKIENKPQSLVREIKQGRENIKKLVDLLDSQEPIEAAKAA